MHVWDEIAQRYDPSLKDAEAITLWWSEGFGKLSQEEQEAIFEELLSREGEQPTSDYPSKHRKYASGHPIPKLSDAPELRSE
jgi:hypothetical protein